MLQGFRYIYRDRNDQNSIIRPIQTSITLHKKRVLTEKHSFVGNKTPLFKNHSGNTSEFRNKLYSLHNKIQRSAIHLRE